MRLHIVIALVAMVGCSSRSSHPMLFATTPLPSTPSVTVAMSRDVPDPRVVPLVPDYSGRWSAETRVRSCVESGFFEALEPTFCSQFPDRGRGTVAVSLVQAGESLIAELTLDDVLLFPPVDARASTNGSVTFTTMWSEASLGLTIEMSVRLEPRRNDLGGTITETWRLAGMPGEGRVVQDIAAATRSMPPEWLESSAGRLPSPHR